ncbi:MAG TPA: T9SS type B sorting domain-containing protein [Flavobacterium sp.]|uniref:T9SS type B sorting domain-containing protein n=1 Tax=unclassified Flavobacterium TaxID=196869 RepID=UPI0025C68F55|nr:MULTISPECIES: T9SS type B sorting domain-containing protein [unclassified Flavobacterium]HRE78837.1 T9SS type B sorting domain-containing protein [Flavobacterium sp.]
MSIFRTVFTLTCLLIAQFICAFELNLSSTNESCPGNGSIEFVISNPDPTGTISYVVFKLPNTSVPYATPTIPLINGLTAGDYLVVATETVGNQTTTQQSTITITNTFTPLSYSVNYLNQSCSDMSNVTVNINSGIASSFEITAGPILFPPQTSNIFSNLPEGTYTIRVFDVCGIAFVTTFTVSYSPSGLTIGSPILNNTVPPSCDFTLISNSIVPDVGTSIAYPLQVTYTVFPPDGSPTYTINQTIMSGDPLETSISSTFPNFNSTNFSYSIEITDNCGITSNQNFTANLAGSVSVTLNRQPCDSNYFTINTANLSPPFQLNFSTIPPGFIPENFNVDYPGPFTSTSIVFGSQDNLVPLGNYSFSISDSCGRDQTVAFSIIQNNIVPNITTGNNGCYVNDGFIRIAIPVNEIVGATVMVAPSSYPFPLPHDVSDQLVNGVIRLDPVPIGFYEITIVDECNTSYEINDIEVPIYENEGLEITERVGCELGKTSIRIDSNNASITNIIITNAPNSFGQGIPFNASSFITPNDGVFFMNNLPPGEYSFDVNDECGFSNSITVTLNEYIINSSSFNPIFNCGSFDVNLSFLSNGINGQSFWIQKLIDPITDTWGHPETNVVYQPDSAPNGTNSIALTNNATNFNFVFNGEFRIVRKFNSYKNGNEITNQASATKVCLEIFNPSFEFNEALEIIDINRSPCTDSGTLDVVVNAIGQAPIQYKLILKDGEIINLDNGNSSIFYSLPLGLYTLQIEDSCGNIKTQVFDVDTLKSVINSLDPADMTVCVPSITNNERFNLINQIPTMINADDLEEYTVTFHTSLSDAQQNLNPITNPTNFNPVSNPQTIYSRIILNLLPSCYEVKSFDVFVGQIPSINLSSDYLVCDELPFTITVNNPLPNTVYTWSNGTVGDSYTTSTLGISTISVTAITTFNNSNLICENTKEITFSISEPPIIDSITTIDWTENQNEITVNSNNIGFHTYSIDGINYQTENIFINLLPGVYTVYVQDTIGCGTVTELVWLLYYPRFFTPNGDGYNERWFIKDSGLEENFIVHIFDRYGKLITVFDSKSEGWDGTFNGQPLFSSDYWFMIYRNDGRVHRGHFSLKR